MGGFHFNGINCGFRCIQDEADPNEKDADPKRKFRGNFIGNTDSIDKNQENKRPTKNVKIRPHLNAKNPRHSPLKRRLTVCFIFGFLLIHFR